MRSVFCRLCVCVFFSSPLKAEVVIYGSIRKSTTAGLHCSMYIQTVHPLQRNYRIQIFVKVFNPVNVLQSLLLILTHS